MPKKPDSIPDVPGFSQMEQLTAMGLALAMMDGAERAIKEIQKNDKLTPPSHAVRQLAIAMLIVGHDKSGCYPGDSLVEKISGLIDLVSPMMEFCAQDMQAKEGA